MAAIPILTATNFSRGAFLAPAFLTNGFVGLRPGPNPLVADPFAGGPSPTDFDPTVPATVAGFLYRDVGLSEVLAPAVYPFATRVWLDGSEVPPGQLRVQTCTWKGDMFSIILYSVGITPGRSGVSTLSGGIVITIVEILYT